MPVITTPSQYPRVYMKRTRKRLRHLTKNKETVIFKRACIDDFYTYIKYKEPNSRIQSDRLYDYSWTSLCKTRLTRNFGYFEICLKSCSKPSSFQLNLLLLSQISMCRNCGFLEIVFQSLIYISIKMYMSNMAVSYKKEINCLRFESSAVRVPPVFGWVLVDMFLVFVLIPSQPVFLHNVECLAEK